MISQNILINALSYENYRSLLESLLAQGKTTGSNQSEEYLNYAKLNLQRMSRLEKTSDLDPALKNRLSAVGNKYIWLVLTEGWCGDAAQNLPVIHAMAQETQNIELKLILRDEHPEIMDSYLTNGARSIPKLICLEKENLREVFVWGPRPKTLQEIVIQLKARGVSKEEKGLIVQKWYNTDKTKSVQEEFMKLIVGLSVS